MAAAELPRPGIEVIQVLRTTAPTILTPTLPPCVVGVCRQVVDVLVGGAVNGDAVINLPAFFLAKAAPSPGYKYLGLDGLFLTVAVNHGPAVIITLASAVGGLAPADVITQVNKQLAAAGVTSAVADVLGNSWRLRTVAPGDGQQIDVVAGSATLLTAFGLVAGLSYFGASTYAQGGLTILSTNFPDPRSNLASVTIEPTTVKVYLGLGTGASLKQAMPTEAFLRRGFSPIIAAATGTVDLSTVGLYGGGGTLTTMVLNFKVDGGSTITVTFASPANAAAVLTAINTAAAATIATEAATTNYLVLTSPTAGGAGSIEILAGTADAILGLTVGKTVGHNVLEALDDGNGDALTPLVAAYDAGGAVDFLSTSPAPSAAVVTAAGIPDFVNLSNKTLILSDGRSPKTINFGTLAAITDVVTAINAAFDPLDGIVASSSGGKLVLTATTLREDGLTISKGADSYIVLFGGSAINGAVNYLDTGTVPVLKVGRYTGNPYAVSAGDEVWVDGKLAGTVIQVAPGGRANVLKISAQVSLTFSAATAYYIEAKNLTLGGGVVTRPRPQITVDGSGNCVLKSGLLRDSYGKIVETILVAGGVTTLVPNKSLIYVAYHGVRLDVTQKAARASLLSFTDTTQLASIVSPITVDNPMALGTYFALLNAPGALVNALGVDETTVDAPYGTVEAYTRAFSFLESVEVYSIAPMTHDATVGQVGLAHVVAMSAPESKGERIVLWNGSTPTAKVDTLVASGLSGQGTADPTQFDTGVGNLAALLIANGVDPSSTVTVTAGLFLDIAADTNSYSIESISGSVIKVRTTAAEFSPGQNDDLFYSEVTLPTGLINEPFAIRIRGASLTLPDGSKDKQGMAETLQNIGQGFSNRRFWSINPDLVKATLGGLEQEIEGFYMCAAIAGMIAQQPPQQSFTNFPMVGFTGVIGSNDFFTEKQLNVIAAGGQWIVTQDGAGTPLFSRMALTTDLTSVETRTDSITKIVDYVAKFIRTGLKTFIGRYNVTQGFLDTISHVVQGLGTFLTDTGILIGFHMNNIVQDADAPDTILLDATLDVPFPCNYIRATLVI